MQKVKILRALSERTVLTTSQLLPTTPILQDLVDAGLKINWCELLVVNVLNVLGDS